MAQLSNIENAQIRLEECFHQRMADLEAKLQPGGPGKDTVARVAEEFRTFRELMIEMLQLLRRQIAECSQSIDNIETRHRRKALIFLGVPETSQENCASVILGTINNTLALNIITASHLSSCQRIGASSQEHHRPILVWFTEVDQRSAVWRAKKKLKGSSISVREFLTKQRQQVFAKARQHFGMSGVWTKNGVVVVKNPDGTHSKVYSINELIPLMTKHPKKPSSSTTGSGGARAATNLSSNLKLRKK